MNDSEGHGMEAEMRAALRELEREIRERRRSEEALRESERKYRSVIENIQDVFYRSDSRGRLLMGSRSGASMFGYDCMDDMIGMLLDSFWPDPKERERLIAQVKASGSVKDFEAVLKRKDGTTFNASFATHFYYDEQGRLLGTEGIIRDITERKKAENALREKEEFIRAFLDTSRDWIWAIDLSGIHTYCNPAVKDMLGYGADEIVGTSAFRLICEEDLDMARARVAKCVEEKQGWSGMVLRWRHKDGSFRYLESNSVPIFAADAGVIGFRGADRDITDRKRVEEELSESVERYRSLFENSDDAILLTVPDGRILQANPSTCRMFGCTDAEIIRMGRSGMVDTTDPRLALALEERNRTGKYRAELTLLRHNGERFPGEVTSVVYRGEDGQPKSSMIIRDNTDRKKAEKELRESEERFRLAFENANTGMCLVDLEGNLTRVNNKMCEIFGYTKEELEGMTVNDIAHPEDLDKTPGFMQDTLQGKIDSGVFQKRYFHKNGRVVTCEVSSSLVRNAESAPLYFISQIHDITERVRAEEESHALREQLRQSQKMEAIGQLAGGIAHDFNNLLTVMKGYIQLSLLELEEDSSLKGNIEQINGAAERAADLARQLLAFSRRQILDMKVLDLNSILGKLHNMLRRLIGEDIELTTVFAKDLGMVRTDLGWIEQAIMNLVVNARDAMASGGKLTIETGNADLDEAGIGDRVGVKPGRYVMLSVSDTGIGMSPEVKDRLFEPFFSTKEKDKGTGLGLSTVYGFVKQSGGDIWVSSEPGKGATFRIYLPRVDEPPDKLREEASRNELLRGSETILLVEDEDDVRKLALHVLERQGYRVLEAHGGDDALSICRRHKVPIHLMLTDVVMPVMSGHELANRLKPLHPEMKVLFMSGYADNEIVLHGVLVQGVNYIQKPFAVDALTRKVRDVCWINDAPFHWEWTSLRVTQQAILHCGHAGNVLYWILAKLVFKDLPSHHELFIRGDIRRAFEARMRSIS